MAWASPGGGGAAAPVAADEPERDAAGALPLLLCPRRCHVNRVGQVVVVADLHLLVVGVLVRQLHGAGPAASCVRFVPGGEY